MQTFDLGDVLTITTGRLVSPRHMDGVYEILNYMTDSNLFTHELPEVGRTCTPKLLAQYPELRTVDVPEVLDKESVPEWLETQYQRFGRTLEVKSIAEMGLSGAAKAVDIEFEDHQIDRVETVEGGFAISHGGLGFVIPDVGVTPQVGDTTRFYGKGVGYPVRGVDINGKEVFYRTAEEQQTKHTAEVERMRARDLKVFEQEHEGLDQRYQALPAVLRTEMDSIRSRSVEERAGPMGEAYMLFVCEEAVKIARALETPKEIRAFGKAGSEEQQRLVPTLNDGHSGNTFGAATALARKYVAEIRKELGGTTTEEVPAEEVNTGTTTAILGNDVQVERTVATFVEFSYPGALFSESSAKEVATRDPQNQEVPEHAFAFRYYDQRETVVTLTDGEKLTQRTESNSSGTYYPGAQIMTVEDVKREVPDSDILVSNMEGNGLDKVVKTRRGNFQPLKPGDAVIPARQIAGPKQAAGASLPGM